MKLKAAGLCMIFAASIILADKGAPVGFSLNDLDGKQVSLSDFAGKVVVLDFWATWCQSCKEAFPRLNELNTELGSRGVVVIGINIEHLKPERIASFVDKADIEYKVLLDPKAETVKTFGIKGVPSLVVINAAGTIQQVFRGIDKETEKQVKDLLATLAPKPIKPE